MQKPNKIHDIFLISIFFAAIGTKNDKFVECPDEALDWRTRRFRMLEEIARHDADIVCLQEVDHFKFLRKSLASLGYVGHFLPKPDSPCLYLADNSGPDGCAIFYKQDKFDMLNIDKRIVEVWRVQTNQVSYFDILFWKFCRSELGKGVIQIT